MAKILYERLGVNDDATQEEIKKAYKKKVSECHPDHGGDPEKLIQIVQAYETLGDEKSRKDYDHTGHTVDERNRSIRNTANSIIQLHFHNALSLSDKIFQIDVIKKIRMVIVQDIARVNNKEKELKRRKVFLEKVQKRMEKKSQNGKLNLFDLVVGEEIKTCEEGQLNLITQRKINKLMLEILDDYRFNYDKEQEECHEPK